jgi:three-Cys-motif partner protein
MTRSRSAVASFKHFYIDGFASAGVSLDKSSGNLVLGSALRVLDVQPPFARYFLVELDRKRYELLRRICSGRNDVETFCGDANVVLPRDIFPRVRQSKYERAFCLLDPYNETNLRWETVAAAAKTEAIDVLIHFPIYSMNINVLRKEGPAQKERLNLYWGDDSWEPIAYEEDPQMDLFGSTRTTKAGNEKIITAYRDRLIAAARFKATSRPIPMRNSKGNIVYYLIFATSSKPTGAKAITAVANHFIKKIEG